MKANCDCLTTGPVPLGVDEALTRLLEAVPAATGVDRVPVAEALGRVLAVEVVAPVAVPPADNSAMDGYALAVADLVQPGPNRLRVSQRIAAGRCGAPLKRGSVARIFTGAPVPPGADAVVMQELCETAGDEVIIRGPVRRGQNIRRAGEDLLPGQTLLPPGIRLRPQHLGLAAAAGLSRLPVRPRPRVALLSTGDELVNPGEPLGPGQIYNANHATLTGLLRCLGCEILDLGIVRDDFEETRAVLAAAAGQADLIISSGGVSVGEEDHVRAAVERLGRLDLWRVAIKPGKPLAFGRVRHTLFLGLPGNPVSLFVTFCLFARPLLLRLQGMADVSAPLLPVHADFDWPAPDRRREYLRARLDYEWDAPGARLYEHQGSGVLSSAAWADGLVVIPPGQVVRRGETVGFLSFKDLLC